MAWRECTRKTTLVECKVIVKYAILVAPLFALITSCSATDPHTPKRNSHASDAIVPQGQLPCDLENQQIIKRSWDEAYIHARGTAAIGYRTFAKALQEAQESARAEIAKQLTLRVEVTDEIEGEKRRWDSGTSFRRTFRERVTSTVPPIELSGVTITGHCVDASTRTVYAFAELNRAKALDDLAKQMAQLDKEMGNYLQIPGYLPVTEQIRRLLPAVKLIERQEKLVETWNGITNNPSVITGNATALNDRITQLVDRLSVTLRPVGQEAAAIEPYLMQYLAKEGIRMDTKGRADLVLEYKLQTRRYFDSGIYFVYADGQVTVKDATGRVINVYKMQAKGGSPIDSDRARGKAAENIGHQLGEAVSQSLLNSL